MTLHTIPFPGGPPGLDRRIAPRPLPLYLATHLMTLGGSLSVWPLWKRGLLGWKPRLAPAADGLRDDLDALGPDALAGFAPAVLAEGLRRHHDFLAGIAAYHRHPYRRCLDEPPAAWAEGTTRLLDYRDGAGPGALPVLVIPSLVNRAYILDLSARRSLMRYLAGRGLAPFLVDWGAPGPDEAGFGLTDYVARRLEPMLDRVTAACGRPPVALGYCMGGLLALALAARRPAGLAGLALLATPFDFHAGTAEPGGNAALAALWPLLDRVIESAGGLPVDVLQAMFAGLDPGLMARKFIALSRLPPRSAKARDFVAVEDWANDGVALTAPVARECLRGWYLGNDPARGAWRIAGRVVRPEALDLPTLLIVPERDRIVPPVSALCLAGRIPGARLLTRPGGHVGLLTGPRAKTNVYGPLTRWLFHLT